MRRSWGVIVLGLIAWVFALNTGREIAYTVAYLITAVIILAFLWTWSGVRWIRVGRFTRARRTQVGRYAEEQFEIENRSPLAKLWLEVRDLSNLPGHQASRVISSLGGHRTQRWTVRTLCLRRGRYTLGPMILSSGDPLGLFRMERVLPATSPMVVYPATVDLPGFMPPMGELPGGDAVRRRTHYVTTNVSGVRDYQPGDSFNRIHWPSTARTGRLIVKEFELDPTTDIWIFLDMDEAVQVAAPWAVETPRLGPLALQREPPRLVLPPSTEEYGVVVAASVARHFLMRNRAVGLISNAQRREVIQADRGERQLTRILETLAVIEARGRMPFAQVLAVEGQHLSRNASVIAISPATSSSWAAALRDLNRRGVRSLAIVLAANTFGPAPSYQEALMALHMNGILTYLVRRGDAIDSALAKPAALEPAHPSPYGLISDDGRQASLAE
ncbi:MAG: DUF58 domain-containing protein [Anaerolineae bacterium]|nr:DUF58 domain-containing protein [Anaerolineae bacterium]MDW8100315.1 DUF58 domain-containing protein [Anaerolineae bacterium]